MAVTIPVGSVGLRAGRQESRTWAKSIYYTVKADSGGSPSVPVEMHPEMGGQWGTGLAGNRAGLRQLGTSPYRLRAPINPVTAAATK